MQEIATQYFFYSKLQFCLLMSEVPLPIELLFAHCPNFEPDPKQLFSQTPPSCLILPLPSSGF